MPLHLLGKKSWNVYNTENIARVRQDEAAHAAREAADEQRTQEEDAERRIRILRGEDVAPPQPLSGEGSRDKGEGKERRRDGEGRERKRRRLHGEDDTERDMRFAAEDLQSKSSGKMDTVPNTTNKQAKRSSDAPLVDAKGNINLFPVEAPKRGQGLANGGKNAEVEKAKKRKEKEFEDQYTMRFSNAAGFKTGIKELPWYHQPTRAGQDTLDGGGEERVGRDVWGNEDPRRKEREKARIVSYDPLAVIKRGVKGLREVERERKNWSEEKRGEIRALDEEEERRAKRRRRERERQREREEEMLREGRKKEDGERAERRHRHRHRRPNRSRRRSRSPSREQESKRRHHRDQDRDRKIDHVNRIV